jgi:hypothetical protein
VGASQREVDYPFRFPGRPVRRSISPCSRLCESVQRACGDEAIDGVDIGKYLLYVVEKVVDCVDRQVSAGPDFRGLLLDEASHARLIRW